jgi:hypothetical protein
VYIDTGSPVPNIPSKSCGLADENNKRNRNDSKQAYFTPYNEKSNRFNVPQLKEFLAFSVKDRYQLNYFICIKDFNAQTITSLNLNVFSFFIYCRQQHDS